MRQLRKAAFAARSAGRTANFQPDYNDEVSQEYRDAMRQRIEDSKPAGFALTPIGEPGW